MRTIISIVLLLALYSCHQDKKPVEKIDLMSNVVQLEGEIISQEEEILDEPSDMVYRHPYLVYISRQEDNFFKVFDPVKGKVVARLVEKGKGPQEFGQIIYIKLDETGRNIDFFDFKAKSFNRLDLDEDDVSNSTFTKVYKGMYNYRQLLSFNNDSDFLGIETFSKSRFVLGNSKGTYAGYKEFVVTANYVITDTAHIGVCYGNVPVMLPNSKRVVNFMSSPGLIEVFDIENKKIEKKWRCDFLQEYLCLIHKGKDSPNTIPEYFTGLNDVAVSKNHIYCLYTTRTFSEDKYKASYGTHIVVFDWDGNYEKTYQLNHAIRNIAISDDEKTLYGSSELIDDDIKIIKYNL